MKSADLSAFDAKFAADDDPWGTFTSRDEAVKRAAILKGLGPAPLGRVLELASGNGSNSRVIAPRTLRLDAVEGAEQGVRLTARAIARWPRARVVLSRLPSAFPRRDYDAVVIAELLYYLTPKEMRRLGAQVGAALTPGGRLVLAHHQVDYYDFAQHARGIHDRFLAATGCDWRIRVVRRNARWIVTTASRLPSSCGVHRFRARTECPPEPSSDVRTW